MRSLFVAIMTLLAALHAGAASRAGDVDSLLHALSGNPAAYWEVVRTAEEHYAVPADPQHDEEAYVAVLRHIVSDTTLASDKKTRYELLLADALKNRPGTTACDFAFVTIDGATGRLHDIATPLTLVYFNDPDCDACRKVKLRLDTCSTLRALSRERVLTVLAVYTGDDDALWQREAFPDYVVNAHDAARAIDDEELYILPSMPLFYLLDSKKTVIVKNEPSLNRILEAIAANNPSRREPR